MKKNRKNRSNSFPVLNAPTGCARAVKISELDRFWILKIHGQSLERMAERGGLTPKEIMLNRRREPLMAIYGYSESDAVGIVNSIAHLA